MNRLSKMKLIRFIKIFLVVVQNSSALQYLNSPAVQPKCSALVWRITIVFGIFWAQVIDAGTRKNKESTAEKRGSFLIAVLFINLKQFFNLQKDFF